MKPTRSSDQVGEFFDRANSLSTLAGVQSVADVTGYRTDEFHPLHLGNTVPRFKRPTVSKMIGLMAIGLKRYSLNVDQ